MSIDERPDYYIYPGLDEIHLRKSNGEFVRGTETGGRGVTRTHIIPDVPPIAPDREETHE